MPADTTVQRALPRSRFAIAVFALAVLVAPLDSHAQSGASGRQVDAFLNGIELDRQLAEQYSAPLQAQDPVQALASQPTAEPTVQQVLDEAAMARLEAEIDAVLALEEDPLPLPGERLATPLQTALLVAAGLCLLGFAGIVLTLAVRELRKEKQQRRRTYRRRVKRRSTESSPAVAVG